MYLLITYDIADRKRLYRVARLMERYGLRVQKSVFECRIDPAQLKHLLGEVKPLLKIKEDRIHIYRICESCQPKFRGFGGHPDLSAEERVLVI